MHEASGKHLCFCARLTCQQAEKCFSEIVFFLKIEKRYSEEKILVVVNHSNNASSKATILTSASIPSISRSCPSQFPKILCSVTLFGVLCRKHLGSIWRHPGGIHNLSIRAAYRATMTRFSNREQSCPKTVLGQRFLPGQISVKVAGVPIGLHAVGVQSKVP